MNRHSNSGIQDEDSEQTVNKYDANSQIIEKFREHLEKFIQEHIEDIKNNPTNLLKAAFLSHQGPLMLQLGIATDSPIRERWIEYISTEPAKTYSQEWSSSRTTAPSRSEDVGIIIRKLLNTSGEEISDEGDGYNFYKKLESIIKKNGPDAVLALYSPIMSEDNNPEVIAETLHCLGKINNPETYELQLWLLEKSLEHPSPWVRDGAILGISYLNDPHAIPSLKSRIEREQRRILRREIEKVLAQLEHTRDAAVVSQDDIKPQ
jgi:hypothetical protein